MAETPRAREKHVTGAGQGLHKHGQGLNIGPTGASAPVGGGGGGTRSSGGIGGKLILIIILLLLGGGGGIGSLLGGLSGTGSVDQSYLSGSSEQYGELQNTGTLNTSVVEGSREKYTTIKGNGTDKITMMVYLCGTDLESKASMATNDLREMASADISDNVNVIVYTGGCSSWRTSQISSSVNQIYQVKKGSLTQLKANMGSKTMTDPETLTEFIKYASSNFPADRYELIFWDHGGGSVTGFGYDQKYPRSGSMTLEGIDTALKNSGIKFDIIGFDACLMATAENALMLSKYGDYLIASEETEPGIGWYYTDWLTKLSNNTSMPTTEIGKNICDDFVSKCAQLCRGQKTTLSVVDLAELSNTLPAKLSAFANNTAQLIKDKQYAQVSKARNGAREFSPSSRIDQVDLANLALNMGTTEGKELSDAILGAVKYNRTSSNITNASGLSIYFPYKKASYVDKIVKTYKKIGMSDDYSRCISSFAKMEVSGQAASGGTASPLSTLLGESASSYGEQAISSLLTQFLGGSVSSISGLDSSNTAFLSDRALSSDDVTSYIQMNMLSDSDLTWSDGNKIALSSDKWSLVQRIDKNVFLDDGEGFINLGLDNTYSIDGKAMIADTEKTWLAIDKQVVPYFHLDTVEEGDNYTITGRIPAFLNDEKVNLICVFDNEHPQGYIAGATYDYTEGETETVAKNLLELKNGDKLKFICDYYGYDGKYQNSYLFGDEITVSDSMEISDVTINDANIKITYLFVDIYNQQHWTPSI